MKKILYVILTLSFSLTNAYADGSASKLVLQQIIDKLDMTSFRNSIGPRREEGKYTLKEYGASKISFNGKIAVVHTQDDSWQYTITLLDEESKICFEDQAMNSGSYHSQNAYILIEDKSGFFKASPIEDTECPAFAK